MSKVSFGIISRKPDHGCDTRVAYRTPDGKWRAAPPYQCRYGANQRLPSTPCLFPAISIVPDMTHPVRPRSMRTSVNPPYCVMSLLDRTDDPHAFENRGTYMQDMAPYGMAMVKGQYGGDINWDHKEYDYDKLKKAGVKPFSDPKSSLW